MTVNPKFLLSVSFSCVVFLSLITALHFKILNKIRHLLKPEEGHSSLCLCPPRVGPSHTWQLTIVQEKQMPAINLIIYILEEKVSQMKRAKESVS